jgi:hypothetical protein
MSRSSNTLKTSDVTTVPIQVKYFASYNTVGSSPLWSNVGITYKNGLNYTGSYFYQIPAASTASFLNYKSVEQLYYQDYISSSVNLSASYANNWQQSTAASGTFDDDHRYFPTESNASVWIVSIPRSVYGQQIARKSFYMSGSTLDGVQLRNWQIIDDGNGNLVEVNSGTVINQRVGNIFYAQGMAIITSQAPEFGSLMFDSAYNTRLDITSELTMYQNEVRCLVNENDFNYTLNPSAIQSGTSGSYINAITGSDFDPYSTTVGLYNDANELLVVGKLSRPYRMPPNTDLTFVVKWDS